MKSSKKLIIFLTFILVIVSGVIVFMAGYGNRDKETNPKEESKAKLHMFFTDENGKPLKDVEIQIVDENHKVIDTIFTDSNGFAESKGLLLGNYYYKQEKVPDGIIIDDLMYDFTLSKPDQVLEAFVECEIENN